MSDIKRTLTERGARYGSFFSHALLAQDLKFRLQIHPGWRRLDPDMMQAMEMFCDKMARAVNGDPRYPDNWHDIAGYAKLVEDRLTAEAAKPSPRSAEPQKRTPGRT